MLEQAAKKYGMVPNLLGELAASPATLQGYMSVGQAFQQSSLNPIEQQVVLLTASARNGCTYCMAAHSTVALGGGMPEAILQSLRDGTTLPEERLEALRQFTLAVVERRGEVAGAPLEAFFAAGYSGPQALEVILGVAMKTISNYVNHFAETPLDPAFAGQAWSGLAVAP